MVLSAACANFRGMTKPQDHHPDDTGAEGGDASGPQPPQYRRPGDTPTADGSSQQGANPWAQPGAGPSAQQGAGQWGSQGSGQWGQAGAGYGAGASQQWAQQNPYGAQGQSAQWQGQDYGAQGYNNQGYGGPNYGNQGYPEQGYAGPGGQWQGQGYENQGYQEQPEEKSNGRNILIIVLLVLALLAAVAFAVFWFTGKPGEGKSSEQTTVSSSEATDARGTEDEDADAQGDDRDEDANREDDDEDTGDEAESRPKNPRLPGYATPVNSSARGSNPGGDLNSVWKSGPTSDSFALAVRDAYVDAYLDGDEDEFNHVVEAYSDVTGTSYTMSCRDNGEYVHCTGGNDANVYIA
ncbi:hypothetical protein I6H52_05135 [Corynebacterium urealyticum]|uniref:Uncharacterized protein n=2 Tax=Corynebacterium urealyticum TaxID=43771 RepID=B1VGG1_CORU7|nr:hypothetical protein CU7111_1289 [Corynebacterium urealyticum DSM 7111]QQB06786.1 hypothetical protein I6H53_05180 [Corynebacterium urealyticum]CAQ05268.1 hypothetical protein cu1308 [Corynebacterium urealyticum DSM 7109]QQC41324.1 hypothetical protein I6H51_06200 [Corynebacterium urealyticum]QQE51709.1 hypothetical protein I6H52_05135 [Corynebacterium urealyticum]